MSLRRAKNIYITDADCDVWSEAEQYVEEHNISMSSFIADILRRRLVVLQSEEAIRQDERNKWATRLLKGD